MCIRDSVSGYLRENLKTDTKELLLFSVGVWLGHKYFCNTVPFFVTREHLNCWHLLKRNFYQPAIKSNLFYKRLVVTTSSGKCIFLICWLIRLWCMGCLLYTSILLNKGMLLSFFFFNAVNRALRFSNNHKPFVRE